MLYEDNFFTSFFRGNPKRIRDNALIYIEGYIVTSLKFRDCYVVLVHQTSDRGTKRIVPYFFNYTTKEGEFREGRCNQLGRDLLLKQYNDAVSTISRTDSALANKIKIDRSTVFDV